MSDPTDTEKAKGCLGALGALGALILAGLLWNAMFGSDEDTEGAEAAAPIAAAHVLYRVTGTADGADITIINRTGQIEQATGRAVPIRADGHLGLDMGMFPSGAPASITAQNTGSTGTLHCEIRADGVVIAEADSVGGFAVVSCRATVP